MLISIPERITRLQNLFLNSITAVLLIDSDGNRLLSKYYQPAHADPKAATTPFKNPFQSLKDQRAFEQAIWEKTRRANGTRGRLVPTASPQRRRAQSGSQLHGNLCMGGQFIAYMY